MANDEDAKAFPPFRQRDGGQESRATEQLNKALDRVLARGSWSGVPSQQTIAESLRLMLQKTTLDQIPLRWNDLIMALIESLEEGTADGWRLKLIGRKGPRGGYRRRDIQYDIAEYFEDKIAEYGDGGYEAALAATRARFQISGGNAKTALANKRAYDASIDEWEKAFISELRQGNSPIF